MSWPVSTENVHRACTIVSVSIKTYALNFFFAYKPLCFWGEEKWPYDVDKSFF